jgi:hypothetical protein
VSTEAGDLYYVNTTARYIRVNMTLNSETTNGIISDFRVYGTLNADSKGLGSSDSSLFKQDKMPETDQRNILLNVYPNPFKDQFTIRIDSPDEEMFDISIFDISGRIVFANTKIPGNTENTFNLQLTQGTYILIVKDKERAC